jgi:hypothetical protein
MAAYEYYETYLKSAAELQAASNEACEAVFDLDFDGYVVVNRDGTYDLVPTASDRFRVIAEGAWQRVQSTGSRIFRTYSVDVLNDNRIGVVYAHTLTCEIDNDQAINPRHGCSLYWNLKEHTDRALEARLVEEARKATEVAA